MLKKHKEKNCDFVQGVQGPFHQVAATVEMSNTLQAVETLALLRGLVMELPGHALGKSGLSIAWRPTPCSFLAYFGDVFFSLFSIIWGHSVAAS
jgi:hypothetical protein